MAKPFLVLQLRPEDRAADSELAALTRYGGLAPDEVVRVQLDREPFPEMGLADYAAIIVGGSPFEVSTPEDEKSDRQRTIEAGFHELLARLVAEDFPFLGACSGSGLLGSYLGVPMSDRYAEPVGGADIELTDAGREDPLLRGFPDRFRVLLGHKEACDEVPPGAVLLARGEGCPVQMFRVGSNVYATQFHPEGDPAGFRLRIDVYRDHGYFPADQADQLMEAVADEDTPVPQAMLRRFVERYRER